MASNETSFAIIDELQAKLAEFERLEATLKERDTTISNLKAFEAALHKSYDSEGNCKQPPSPPLPPNTSLTLPPVRCRNRSKQILSRHHAHDTRNIHPHLDRENPVYLRERRLRREAYPGGVFGGGGDGEDFRSCSEGGGAESYDDVGGEGGWWWGGLGVVDVAG